MVIDQPSITHTTTSATVSPVTRSGLTSSTSPPTTLTASKRCGGGPTYTVMGRSCWRSSSSLRYQRLVIATAVVLLSCSMLQSCEFEASTNASMLSSTTC